MKRRAAVRGFADRTFRQNDQGCDRASSTTAARAARFGRSSSVGGGVSSTSRLKTGSEVYCEIPLPRRNGRYVRSRSGKRHPSMVVSSVATSATQPQSSARRRKLATSSSDVLV